MRKFIMILFLALTVISSHRQFVENSYAAPINYEQWEQILNRYVNADGLVDYDTLKANRSVLDNFITSQIANADIKVLTDDGQKAFWINAYNALTVRLILDHYPLKFGGIRTINWGRPWSITMQVAGQKLSLGDIEHKILRKWDPNDPRIHFAINCASIGCPKLPTTHFNPDRLDQQLDFETRRFINDREKVALDRSKNILYYSAIFSWFEEDFLVDYPDLQTYILKYINEDDKNYILAHKDEIVLRTMKYDWGLNKQ